MCGIIGIVSKDDDVRVVVITGEGKAFCSGQDLKDAAKMEIKSFSESLHKRYNPIIKPIRNMSKPVICRLNGVAAGAGCSLALACDLRIASRNAKFGLTEVKIASLAGLNGTQSLPRVIPQAVAMKMLLTGEMITAEQACHYGLISDVVEPEELMDLALLYAGKIAEAAPLSVQATKQAVSLGKDLPLEHGITFAHMLWGLLRDTEDRKEGFQAFAEKRAPSYKGM